VAWQDAQKDADLDAAGDALVSCTRKQVANLLVNSETASAVAAASLSLCHAELSKAALALEVWSGGAPCVQGSSKCREAERVLTKDMLPALTALAMQLRADTVRKSPTHGNTSKAPADSSNAKEVFGTAFLVSTDGKALTNAHVVEGCELIQLSLNGQQRAAQLLARDDGNDLALLETDVRSQSVSNWRLSVRQGEDIAVYGFPLIGVLASGGNITIGNVTALAGLRNDSRYLQISAPVQPGNSGGPLLDKYGNVVGIVVAKLNAVGVASVTGDIPQNVNFAIKASVVAAFLDAQRVDHAENKSSGMLSTPDIAERAKAFTAQVVCVR
jgi:S1-C subfamily serine protease